MAPKQMVGGREGCICPNFPAHPGSGIGAGRAAHGGGGGGRGATVFFGLHLTTWVKGPTLTLCPGPLNFSGRPWVQGKTRVEHTSQDNFFLLQWTMQN